MRKLIEAALEEMLPCTPLDEQCMAKLKDGNVWTRLDLAEAVNAHVDSVSRAMRPLVRRGTVRYGMIVRNRTRQAGYQMPRAKK